MGRVNRRSREGGKEEGGREREGEREREREYAIVHVYISTFYS